jgi:hypothetical protein
MKKPYLFSWYGANQVMHLVPVNTMSGYDVYGMMPRAKKGYAVPYLANNLSRSGEFVYRRSNDLYDVDKQPDRYITFFKNPLTNDMKIGCASGLSLTRGVTRDNIRNMLFPIESGAGSYEVLTISPPNYNKAYFRVITAQTFENGIIPSSYIGQYSTYLTYFDPMANTGQVYWYKDTDGYVIYAHYQEAHERLSINLPKEMEGLSVEVVDKTDGVTLITDFIENGKLYLTADSTDHNYIVLKTK